MELRYRKPLYDPFDLHPSKTLINECLKQLKTKAYETLKETRYWKNNPDRAFCQFTIDQLEADHKRLCSRIRIYQAYVHSLGKAGGGFVRKQGITDLDIARARGASVVQLYQGQLRKSGDRWIGVCPFHEEKHGSFVVYPEGRGWWCHGCNQGGSPIDFIMKQQNLEFIQAVKYLIQKP